jgi:hypothetical protein
MIHLDATKKFEMLESGQCSRQKTIDVSKGPVGRQEGSELIEFVEFVEFVEFIGFIGFAGGVGIDSRLI